MRTGTPVRHLVLCTALLMIPPRVLAQDQRAVLELVVNEVPKGEAFVILREGDVLVTIKRLADAGLDDFGGTRAVIDDEETVSLASLSGSLAFSVDERDLRLIVTASPELLGQQVRTLGNAAPADMVYRSDTSAFVNYALNWDEMSGTGLFAESAVHVRNALLYSTWTAGDSGRRRGLTSLSFDERPRARRWVVGDAFARAGPLGGDAWTGGVTLTREFGIAPYVVRHPSLSLSAPVAVPSIVEVQVNGRVVSQERVEPGRLDLRDLPLTVGRNDARVFVRDAFGGTQEISASYYLASSVLAPGVHDYQYSLGFRRAELGTTSWGYKEPIALARHRVGVTNRLTFGGRAEASRDLVSLGPSVNVRLGLGEIETAGAVSGGRDGYGTAMLAGYTFAAQPVSAGASVMAASGAYTVVNARPVEQRSALEASVYGSVAIGSGVSFTAQHSQASLHGGLSRYRTSLLSTVRGSRSIQLTASVARMGDEDGGGYEAYAGLSLQLGRTSTTTSVAANRSGASVAVDAQSPLPVGIGYGYQARVESGMPGSASGTVQYQGEYGRYEVRHDAVGRNRRSSVSAAGSVVAIGGSLFASRPVSQSFALVRVPGVEGVRGFASNQEVGRTNASGDLLVPDLQPYYGNLLNISDSDIPLDYSVGHVRLTLALPFRGGALAVFPVQLIRRVTGTMRIGNGVTLRVPEYGEIRVTLAGTPEPIVSPLGGGGEFYFENLPGGQLDAVVQDSQGTCALVLEVPDDDEPIVHLGEIRCETQESPR